MPQPQLDKDAIDVLLAIADPLERAARITDYGRPLGTLPPVLAAQRTADLATSREAHSASTIAGKVRMARSGIFRLTHPKRLRAALATLANQEA